MPRCLFCRIQVKRSGHNSTTRFLVSGVASAERCLHGIRGHKLFSPIILRLQKGCDREVGVTVAPLLRVEGVLWTSVERCGNHNEKAQTCRLRRAWAMA